MNRRKFLSTAATASVLGVSGGTLTGKSHGSHASKPFKLNYAPGFRHFVKSAGKDEVNMLQFIYDHGFRAIEDNKMMSRDPHLQKKIGKELERLDMTMGVFVTGFGMYSLMMTSNAMGDKQKGQPDKKAVRAELKKTCLQAIETQKRVNGKWTTVVLGAHNPYVHDDYQFTNVVENLKYCCDLFEKTGLVIVLEPLNYINHPGVFLKTVPQAYAVCKAVNHPCCKILNDLYHQQIEMGNLIHNIDRAWEETAYIQVGDVPGRKEPTTGEINYKNVFKHLYNKGYEGPVGMEHGISRPGVEGEQRLIQAYREVDDFQT